MIGSWRHVRNWSRGLCGSMVAIGCTTQIPRPSSVDLEIARSRWPEATLDGLEAGRQLYVRNCAGCHELVRPSDFAPEDWIETVEEMRIEAEVELTDQQASRIQRYLYSASHAERDPRSSGFPSH